MTARAAASPVRDGPRNDSAPATPRGCAVCAAALPSTRARYCSPVCRQRAFRLRRADLGAANLPALRRELRRRRALVAHTVYEGPSCEERFVGERRCPDCHRFCRALGLGGTCPDCDRPILLAELAGTEVPPA
jgi:ssDNA-binding Zn-finger/Zn-ribbon topoisomerase 1